MVIAARCATAAARWGEEETMGILCCFGCWPIKLHTESNLPFNSWQSYLIASYFLLCRTGFAKYLGLRTVGTERECWCQVTGKTGHFAAAPRRESGISCRSGAGCLPAGFCRARSGRVSSPDGVCGTTDPPAAARHSEGHAGGGASAGRRDLPPVEQWLGDGLCRG